MKRTVLPFWVAGSQPLLTAALIALLQEICPDASVNAEPPGDAGGRLGPGVALGMGDRWLFVSASPGPDKHAAHALTEGATAVLTLASGVDEFERALEAVMDGEASYVPVDLMRWLADRATAPAAEATADTVHLTDREREILRLLARGMSNSEVAEALTISVNTVRTHLHSLAVKLEATSRAKIVANARVRRIPEAFEHDDEDADDSGSRRTA